MADRDPAEVGETGSHMSTGSEVPITSGDHRLYLLVVGDDLLATHPLPRTGCIVIGRALDSDIQIDDASISRHHARFHIGAVPEIEDLNSANGTFIGGREIEPLQRSEIRPNEPLQLGSVTVIVQRRTAQSRRNRIRNHDYFENRTFDECARAVRINADFVILHVISRSPEIHEALQAAVRDSDVIAEYGPGEFEILLVDTDRDESDLATGRLRDVFAKRSITAQFGSAAFGPDGRDSTALGELARNRAHGFVQRETVVDGVVVADERMRTLHELVARVAAADISVLLLGETGVGKEIVAEMIHHRSSRATKPLLRLNCSALTETLLESELFGHERGAFTGANQQKPGLLEVAEGGVLFLDEIGEMRLSTQAKLLRVLDERKVMRVGGVKALPIDVRLVSATNRDLEVQVARGAFRADLLYRINAMSILIPPLRERPLEIVPLARHFIQAISTRTNRKSPRLSAAASEALLAYSWPGNVRELRNAIERALVFCGDEITITDLPWEKMASFTPQAPRLGPDLDAPAMPDVPELTPPAGRSITGGGSRPSGRLLIVPPIDEVAIDPDERRRIITALESCAGNQTQAAQMLGISRRTLIARIEKYAVPRPRKR